MVDNSYLSSIFNSIGVLINEVQKQEIMYFFPLVFDEKSSKYQFKNSYSIVTQPLGTFFTDFLNIDFKDIQEFKDFFIKYSLAILGTDYKKLNISESLTEDEFANLINKVYSEKSSMLIRIQEQLDEILDYCIINPRKRKNEYTPLDRFLVLQSVHSNLTLFRNNKMEVVNFYKIDNEPLAYKSEDEIYKLLDNKNNKIVKLSAYIPSTIEALIYFVLCSIVENKLHLKICKNCDKYFLTSNSKINYCDNIAPGSEKACKDIGVASTFQNTIENDELLKRYYKIYSRKSMMAKRNPDIISYIKDFENYKKNGKVKIANYKSQKITADDFKNWLDKKDK